MNATPIATQPSPTHFARTRDGARARKCHIYLYMNAGQVESTTNLLSLPYDGSYWVIGPDGSVTAHT